ncbi:hypothetical protein [Tenacibaculum sp. 190524A05c]|uniref:hypothetical protein n=1 Tax=Tenacibaculum platacis TaxID=3137852 RepID=UPI0032B18C92
MKKIQLSIVLTMLCSFVFAQNKIDSIYSTYFEKTREVPFLHLNKTSFLLGEEIWFKAYILEQNSQKLHPTTSNLYVSIFHDDGTLKDQQLIHINKGVGNGNIFLDSTFTDKTYYLKASTRWMKNFNEDNSYYEKINIVNNKLVNTKSNTEKDFFEFKLFPESGHILANSINKIGILIKDANNKGIRIKKGVIKDEEGKTIRQFNTNEMGMNSVQLYFKENQIYTFYAHLDNGIKIKATTQLPSSQGLILKTINKSDKLVINITTNSNTLKNIDKKEYRVLIHNTRSYRDYYFKLNKKNKNYVLLIENKTLEPGINIVTLFNHQNKPISERLTYIHSDNLFHKLNIDSQKTSSDSLEINLSNDLNEKIFASASFLPQKTKAYKPENNIISTFLLKPYVKGHIEKPESYFSNFNKNQLRNLDLLLLTQGWSKYNWNTIFNKPRSLMYKFENGIDITAKINQKLSKKETILFYSKENGIVRVIKPNENPWTLRKTLIKKNSVIDFGLYSKEKLVKIAPSLSFSNAKMNEKFDFTYALKKIELEVSNFKPLKSNYEELDEVIINANKKDEKEDFKVYGSATMFRKADIQNQVFPASETVIDYLTYKNFNFRYDEFGSLSISPGGVYRYSGSSRGSFNRPLVRLFLDGNDISYNAWLIEGMYLDTVKEIFFGRDPSQMGSQIHIFTLPPNEYFSKSARYVHVNVPVGFATEKEYYSPKYPSFVNETYKKFGAIYWNPNTHIPSISNKKIKIAIQAEDKVNLYLEGITSSGKLISQKVILKTD